MHAKRRCIRARASCTFAHVHVHTRVIERKAKERNMKGSFSKGITVPSQTFHVGVVSLSITFHVGITAVSKRFHVSITVVNITSHVSITVVNKTFRAWMRL